MKIWLTSTLWLVLLFVCVSYQDDTTPETEANGEGEGEGEAPSEEEGTDTEPEDETEPEVKATTEDPKDSAETCKVVSMATVLSVILLNRVIV